MAKQFYVRREIAAISTQVQIEPIRSVRTAPRVYRSRYFTVLSGKRIQVIESRLCWSVRGPNHRTETRKGEQNMGTLVKICLSPYTPNLQVFEDVVIKAQEPYSDEYVTIEASPNVQHYQKHQGLAKIPGVSGLDLK